MKSTLLTTLALTPLSLVAQDRVKPEKPNILIILADDLGYGDVGCYNTMSRVATPNLDRLARQGIRFTDAHSPSTVSTPSRYSLLTGRMAFRIPYKGVFAGVGGPCLIKEDQLTLPQMLRNQGYATAMTGKWHVGLSFFDKDGQRITKGGVEGVQMIDYSHAIPDGPVNRGFDRFFGTACCPATDFLYAFIDGDRIPVPPTGMLDKSTLPKHPYANDNRDGMIAPDYDLEKLDQVFLQKSLQFLDEHAKSHPEKPFFLFHSMNAVHLPSFASKQFQGSTKAGPHGDFINELDYLVGELMKALERHGMADNTVVMFSSDNGPETTSVIHMRADYGHDGARPWRGVKRDQWEGGHRVPFIVRWPGKIVSGSTSDQTVCLTDIMATCAAITGASLPDGSAEDSYNILPLLLGNESSGTIRPYTLHQTTSLAMAIRKGPWKYLDHRGSGGNNYDNPGLKPFALPNLAPDAPAQLYNLETDPGETLNLYFKHPEIVRELKELLEKSKAQGDTFDAPDAKPTGVVGLRCEYLETPLGIDVVKPGLSWRIEAQGGKGTTARSERGLKQTAYQILVSTSEELLRMDKGDLWDSGRMESDQSIQVEYNGKPLGSGIQCYWKVRIWTSSTLDTEPETPNPSSWSRPAIWTMGLLNPSDWQGEWIRFKEADTIKHIWYRKKFSLESLPVSTFAYLCSIGYHELYVNGEKIGTSVLSPGVTNLEKRALYVTYDISSKLKKGDNVIAVWTGPGWARADGSYGKGVWKQNSIFKCQVNMSNGMSLHTDESWKCKISSSENLGLWKGGGEGEYGGELIDARRHIANWNLPSFDDRDWANATVYQKSLILSAEMQEPDRKVETLVPVAITFENGQYRIDMGRNFTGWFEIDLHNGKAGDTVKIMTANRAEETLEFNQESQYIFDATGKGTFCHRFNYMAGRWITIAGLSYRPEPNDIRGYIVTNDRKRIGKFECSNPLFNEIYETDLRTYIACSMNGVTMDCPHRERFGYGEVALACTWGCAIPNFESAAYYRKAARDWFDVQREDGFVNTIAPQVYKGAGGTLWSSAPVTLSWEFYKAYGDKRQLGEAYLPMKKWLDFLHKSVSADGVLTAYEKASRFLGDWATPHGSEYGDTPEAKLFNNCVYAYCLDVLVQAAGILGKPDDVATYSARLADLRKSVHKQFFNEDTKTYIDGRQLAMAFPLYTGITPEHERKAVFANFVEEISKRKPFLDTGSSGLPILLKYIVEDAERADLLYPCLTSLEQPGYGFFLQSGETTWPEYWKITGEASRIHTCYTGIAGYFTRALGGIRPDPTAYGMQKFLIKPAIAGDLTWVNTHHDSFYGRISSNWKREVDKLTMEVTIPANTTATVYVPAGDAATVTEGGKPIGQVKGVKFLRMENGAAVYEVGSGTYRFQADNRHTTTNKTSRLYLELVKTEPVPVIGPQHPDAKDIPAGFEAGTTVKVTIDGKTAYHMVSTTMETFGATRWANMRTEHWISEDGSKWRRHRILFRPGKNPETGMWELTASPFFFFDEKENRWFVYFNFLAYDRIRSWNTPTLLRRAGAKTTGMEGINGEFEYPGEIVAPSGIAHPTDAAASSISPPFQAADGKWYAFLGGGPKPFNDTSGNWWVLIVKAKGPEGPFTYMPDHAPEPFMDPTGFVENPLMVKIKGPVTGKEYWTVIFNHLQPEVTTGNNSQIGFSFSENGLTWPVGNAQIIDMDKGLPAGTNPWWRCIRVPHHLADEGNGLYTCFFSAYDKQGEFESIGKATFRVKEIVE